MPNQSILDLTVIPDPVGGDVYIVKDNTNYRVSAGGGGGLATLGPDGKLLAAQTPPVAVTVTWGSISGKPTTLAGYAITDAASDAELGAVDAAAVHIAGAETITGAKTFSSPPTVSGATAAYQFKERDTGTTWQWYADGGVAYLWRGTTRLSLDSATNALTLTGSLVIPTGVNARLFIPDGTLAAPSLVFSADGSQNTGLYRSAENTINMVCGAVTRGLFSPTGLDVTGAITATGNITGGASDKRLKSNIQNIRFPMDKLFKIGGYTFSWNLEKCMEVGYNPRMPVEHGVLAQEVQKVLPDAVYPAAFDKDYLTVDYARIVPLLIECIKELNNRIDRLENRED